MNYKNKQWKAVRDRVLRRDGYLCQSCLRYGIRTEGKHVHHKIPINSNELLKYNVNNLITLCTSCHNKVENRTTHKLTQLGITIAKGVRNKVKIIVVYGDDYNKNKKYIDEHMTKEDVLFDLVAIEKTMNKDKRHNNPLLKDYIKDIFDLILLRLESEQYINRAFINVKEPTSKLHNNFFYNIKFISPTA